ncbi:MAG TPA: LEA type 2 family protein [Chitinophagaceae bacterium]|nr:LEA type 2 family protein [Chitinophagaceae bacterium]
MKNLHFTWLALLALLLTVASCNKPVAPEYRSIENFRVNNLGVGESAISADLKYYNPNNFSLKLKYGETDVYLNNKLLGKTVLDTMTIIPARDSFLIPVSMKVDMKQVYANALDILLSNEITIRLDGFAKMGKGALFFNMPIKYEGLQKLDIHL